MNRGDYMLIDLSNVLSEPHKSLDETVPCTLEVFQSKLGTFPVLSKEDVYITIDYVKDRQIEIHGTCGLVIEIPCDRCLEPVPTEFHLDFTKKVEQEFLKKRRWIQMNSMNQIILTDMLSM